MAKAIIAFSDTLGDSIKYYSLGAILTKNGELVNILKKFYYLPFPRIWPVYLFGPIDKYLVNRIGT